MGRRQFAFLMGVLLVWMAWAAGWIVLAGIAAGLLAWAAVAVLEGDLDISDLSDRFRPDR